MTDIFGYLPLSNAEDKAARNRDGLACRLDLSSWSRDSPLVGAGQNPLSTDKVIVGEANCLLLSVWMRLTMWNSKMA